MPHLQVVCPGNGSKTPHEFFQAASGMGHTSKAGRQSRHRTLEHWAAAGELLSEVDGDGRTGCGISPSETVAEEELHGELSGFLKCY